MYSKEMGYGWTKYVPGPDLGQEKVRTFRGKALGRREPLAGSRATGRQQEEKRRRNVKDPVEDAGSGEARRSGADVRAQDAFCPFL